MKYVKNREREKFIKDEKGKTCRTDEVLRPKQYYEVR